MTLSATAPTLPEVAPAELALTVRRWRDYLRTGRTTLEAAFRAQPSTPALLAAHARLVDRVLAGVWGERGSPEGVALIAVGGYGRGELFPHSDVDVLVLLPHALDDDGAAFVERFIGMLWDIGMEVGHSVRTIADCEANMASDITVKTSLLEHRLIKGSRELYADFGAMLAANMDVRAFYEAKVLEQQQRHLKYHDTAYNLEPNIKESPGGLRDLQAVTWIARAAGLGHGWGALAKAGLILMRARRARWRGRSASSADCACGCIISRGAARTGSCSTSRTRWRAKSACPTRRRGARASS